MKDPWEKNWKTGKEPWEQHEKAGKESRERAVKRRPFWTYLLALRARWNRTGYPAWLFFGSLSAAGVVMILPAVLLVAYANRLGIWWANLLILYLGALFSGYAVIVYPREMAHMRYLLGDEAFFLVYPEERKKELRRLVRQQRRERKTV